MQQRQEAGSHRPRHPDAGAGVGVGPGVGKKAIEDREGKEIRRRRRGGMGCGRLAG